MYGELKLLLTDTLRKTTEWFYPPHFVAPRNLSTIVVILTSIPVSEVVKYLPYLFTWWHQITNRILMWAINDWRVSHCNDVLFMPYWVTYTIMKVEIRYNFTVPAIDSDIGGRVHIYRCCIFLCCHWVMWIVCLPVVGRVFRDRSASHWKGRWSGISTLKNRQRERKLLDIGSQLILIRFISMMDLHAHQESWPVNISGENELPSHFTTI